MEETGWGGEKGGEKQTRKDEVMHVAKDERLKGIDDEGWNKRISERKSPFLLAGNKQQQKKRDKEQTHKSALRLCRESRPAGCYIRSPQVFLSFHLIIDTSDQYFSRRGCSWQRIHLFSGNRKNCFLKIPPLFTHFPNILLARMRMNPHARASANESTNAAALPIRGSPLRHLPDCRGNNPHCRLPCCYYIMTNT